LSDVIVGYLLCCRLIANPCLALPVRRSGWFRRDVIRDSVHTGNFVDDPRRDTFEHVVRYPYPVGIASSEVTARRMMGDAYAPATGTDGPPETMIAFG